MIHVACTVIRESSRMYTHARIQEFSPGCVCVCGGGGPGQSDKKSSDNFFFSPQLILQKSNGHFQRNLSFFNVPEGVQHFPGWYNFFQGGSNCLFPIETHITCDFPGGGVRTPCHPPLDPNSMRTFKGDREKWGWGELLNCHLCVFF